jgi:putative membrane protein
MNLLVCSGFSLISEAGRVLEDPFTMFWNGLPLGAMSKTIEINLRQRLGDEDVPAQPTPDANGILM